MWNDCKNIHYVDELIIISNPFTRADKRQKQSIRVLSDTWI